MPAQNNISIGFGNSMFQSSGRICGASNWTHAATKGTVPKAILPIAHWDNFENDLDLMAEVGVDSYRISLEWSHIEPVEQQYNKKVLDRYHALIDACLIRGITPMLTLYHFNEPLWFTKLGGFEKAQNIRYFIVYCQYVFKFFSAKVNLWCTINEPAVQAFSGYLLGQFPPHRHSLQMTINVLYNLLLAHVKVYSALKSIANNQTMIGMAHNVLRFKSRYQADLITKTIAQQLTTITDDLVMQFFKTGDFDYHVNWLNIHHNTYNFEAPAATDFFGLNFYANPIIGPNLTNGYGATCMPEQEMGDMYLPIDPSGFSEALDTVATLNKPIYITEMGIADRSDLLRQKFLTQYFNVIKQKLNLKFDIRGCYLWTFKDNYEWNEGYGERLFGFFNISGEARDSVQLLKTIISSKLTRKD